VLQSAAEAEADRAARDGLQAWHRVLIPPASSMSDYRTVDNPHE
jgi:hypothetical protein